MLEAVKDNKTYKDVAIRTWDDMEAEYGLDGFKHIPIGMSWSKQSDESLPRERIIRVEVLESGFTPYKWGDLFISENMLVQYSIGEEAIEKMKEKKLEEYYSQNGIHITKVGA